MLSQVSQAIHDQIVHCAETARRCGQVVEIDERLPSVLLKAGRETYFFQEHTASDLLADARLLAEEYEVSAEDVLLHQAQSW